MDGHEQRAGFPAPCPYPSGLFADFEVAYIAPAIGGLEPHLLFGFPVEGYLPQKFHLLDAPQKVCCVLGIFDGVLDLDHRAVGTVPEVAECLRNAVGSEKSDVRVGHGVYLPSFL